MKKAVVSAFLTVLIASLPVSGFARGKEPCSGSKGGVSHCDGAKFVCNDGTISQSKRSCSSESGSQTRSTQKPRKGCLDVYGVKDGKVAVVGQTCK